MCDPWNLLLPIPLPRNSHLYSRRQKSIVPVHSSGVYVSCSKNEHYAHSKWYLHQNRRNVSSFYLISTDECPNFLSENLTPRTHLVWNVFFIKKVLCMRKQSRKSTLHLFILRRAFNIFPEIATAPAKGRSIIVCMPSNVALLHHFSSCSLKD